MVSRAVNETGLSPPRGAFVSPIRLALVDDVNAGVVDTRIVTRLSGDGRITWRNRKAALRTDAATATIVCACNTGHVPRLSLHDAAVAARLREIPYPTVRNPDPDFGARMRPPARAAARLARLVQAAVHLPRHDAPPAETESVRVATAGRVDDDAGAWGLCARRGVQGRAVHAQYPGLRAWCEAPRRCRTWRAVSTGQSSRADCARSSPAPWRNRRRWTVARRPRLVRLDAVGRRAGREGGRLPDLPAARGGTGCPSLLVPVFLEEDTMTVCDRVTVTTADGTPGVVSTVAYRTRVQGSEAEFETAWKSFGAPEDGAVDPKPLVVVQASVRRGPADPGPPLSVHQQAVRSGCMRRSPVDSTTSSLAAF